MAEIDPSLIDPALRFMGEMLTGPIGRSSSPFVSEQDDLDSEPLAGEPDETYNPIRLRPAFNFPAPPAQDTYALGNSIKRACKLSPESCGDLDIFLAVSLIKYIDLAL